MAAPTEDGIRLQRVMAGAGIGSRRHCEELIERRRVSVDGKTVTVQGMRVDPATAIIHVDGMRISTAPDKLYLALHKPAGVVSAMSDPDGRRTVADLVPPDKGLFHVGRLDAESEGLLLITNDGELAHRLTHPSYGVQKTYLAEVRGPLKPGLSKTLRAGVELEDGPVTVDSFRAVSRSADRIMVEVVVHEGRNHVVRRVLDAVGHPVERLVRTKFGPLPLGDLRPGRTRVLSQPEIGSLFKAVKL